MTTKFAPLLLEDERRNLKIGGLVLALFLGANGIGYCTTAQRLDEGLSMENIESSLQQDSSQSIAGKLSTAIWYYGTYLGRETAYTWHKSDK